MNVYSSTKDEILEALTPMLEDATLLTTEEQMGIPAVLNNGTVIKGMVEEFERKEDAHKCMLKWGSAPFIVVHWGMEKADRWAVLCIFKLDDEGRPRLSVGFAFSECYRMMIEHLGRRAGVHKANFRERWLNQLASFADEVVAAQLERAMENPAILATAYVGPTFRNKAAAAGG